MATSKTSQNNDEIVTSAQDESLVFLEKQEAFVADETEHKLTMSAAFKVYYRAVLWSATLSMALVMESYGTSESTVCNKVPLINLM